MALEDANPIKGVSGPGKYAKRLDRIPANQYGDQKETGEIASGAPLAKTPDVKPQALPQIPQGQVTPLFAQSERPNEPVTTGINIGAGPGAEALAMRQPTDVNFLSAIKSYMPVLSYISGLPNTSPETRQVIRQLRDML